MVKRKKPAKKAGKALKARQNCAQKEPLATVTPAPDAKRPAQLPGAGQAQPRSSAQAKAAASAMRRALDTEEAGTPAVRETHIGKPHASST